MRAALAAALGIVIFALGWMAGARWSSTAPRHEPPAPAIIHRPGIVTLERSSTQPPPRIQEAPGELIRTVALTLPPSAEIQPLQIDLTRLEDGTHRVTVAGPEGITGLDFPAAPAAEPPPPPRWTIAATHDGRKPGAVVEYRRSGWAIVTGWTGGKVWIGAGLTF